MSFDQFLIMRHELLLATAAIVILLAELFASKRYIPSLAIALFTGITIAGFLPANEGAIFGGMYQSDPLRILMKNILNIGVLIILLQSLQWIQKPENQEKVSEYFLLLFSTLIGMSYMISAGDFLMFYLGLELATLPLAALATYERSRSRSAEAGIKMILSAAFSSAVMVFGLSFLYATTGTLYFSNFYGLIDGNILQVLGFIFFFAGMGFKISLVPFHFWTADVYEGAPVNVTSFFSVISKGAAVFIFIILLFTIFKPMIDLGDKVIYIAAVGTMTIGNLFALRQQNLKRLLAFSSIAQAGFIMLGFIAGSQQGMASVLYFILIYIFSNLGAFGVVSVISENTGKENISDYNGLYHTNPKLSLVMTLSLFSLAGIPPVAGFFGKFFLFTAAAGSGYYWLVFIAVLNATLSLYYYLGPVKAMFINKSDNPIAAIRSNLPTKIAFIICVTGLLLIGFASKIFEIIHSISFGV